MPELFNVLFGLLFVSILVWFALCLWLFKRLEEWHPEKYAAMGKPSLIMNNSLSNNISFLNFLANREYLDLNDPAISKLAQFMRVYFLVLLTGFIFFFLGVSFGYVQ